MPLITAARELQAAGCLWSHTMYVAVLAELPKTLGVYIRAHPAQAAEIENCYRACNEPFRIPVVRDMTCELNLVEFVCVRNHTIFFQVLNLSIPIHAYNLRSRP